MALAPPPASRRGGPATALDRWFERVFSDSEPSHPGSGWISGTLSVFLGSAGLLGVLVLWFPAALSTARFRALYPLGALRLVLEGVLYLALLLGGLSLLLRRRKRLGLVGCGLALAGALLGGGRVPAPHGVESPLSLGLDWFVLNVLALAIVFVPLERGWPLRPGQSSFRPGWTTDGLYFLVSHLLVQGLSFLTLLPAVVFQRALAPGGAPALLAGQPAWLQFLEIVLVADLAQYAVHRAFHRVPWLWRFHEIHHSSRALDWLAGSRLHPVDAVATRGLVLAPLQLLGFATAPLYAYLVFVSFHAVFVHANLRVPPGWFEAWLVTPRFHHWHHAAAADARDRNFAVHLPWLDRLFGTHHLPGCDWPAEYGLGGDRRFPEGFAAQLAQPFR